MKDIYITLAVEDYLSEVVVRKLLEQTEHNYQVIRCLCNNGNGYLKSNINNFNEAAKHMPFFVLTDQDRGCPIETLSSWLTHETSKYFIFRIAVMEVESWVMAHREAFADFFSISLDLIPRKMDELSDPKQSLINLVRSSRSSRLRADIIPANGSTAKVGPDYNNRLSQFVQTKWNALEAERHSESLRRALFRIKEFGHNYNKI